MKRYFIIGNYIKTGRRLYRRYISNEAFLVAGLGRCGTTLLTETLIENGLYPSMKYITDLNHYREYTGGYLYKTHDYPPDIIPDNVRVVYLFRNPMNIALSAYYKINQWGEIHHRHFHSDMFRPNDDILYQDTLQLERQFDAWFKCQGFDFISIKYENLFDPDTKKMLGDFLGVDLKFSEVRPSATNYQDHPKSEYLIKAYASLARKIEKAPGCKIWKSSQKDHDKKK